MEFWRASNWAYCALKQISGILSVCYVYIFEILSDLKLEEVIKSIPNPFWMYSLFYIFKKYLFYYTNSFLHDISHFILYFTKCLIKIIL